MPSCTPKPLASKLTKADILQLELFPGFQKQKEFHEININALREAIRSEYPGERLQAVQKILNYGTPEALELLTLGLRREEVPLVDMEILSAMRRDDVWKKATPEDMFRALPRIVKKLESENKNLRDEALQTLATFLPVLAIEFRELKDERLATIQEIIDMRKEFSQDLETLEKTAFKVISQLQKDKPGFLAKVLAKLFRSIGAIPPEFES